MLKQLLVVHNLGRLICSLHSLRKNQGAPSAHEGLDVAQNGLGYSEAEGPVMMGRRNTILQISLRRRICAHWPPRWICEQAHQQLKEELGLDHFEGRSWQGLHRHALMTMIAYAFLQYRRRAHAGRKKKNQRTSASANHARRSSRHRRSHPSPAVSAVPILPKTNP